MAHGFPAFGSSLGSSRHLWVSSAICPHCIRLSGPASGEWEIQTALPLRRRLPSIPSAPAPASLFGNFAGTTQRSDCLGAFIVGVWSRPSRRDQRWTAPLSGLLYGRCTQALPIGSPRCIRTCSGLRPRRVYPALALTSGAVWPCVRWNHVGTRKSLYFGAHYWACTLPCQRFTGVITGTSARLGARMVGLTFPARDLHPLTSCRF